MAWLDPISRQILRGAPEHRPVVLTYHSIVDDRSRQGWKWAVTRRDFLAQIDLLAAFGWRTVRVGDLARPAALPPRAVAITFDDGYADNAFAFEALRERGMTATWFVVSDTVGGEAAWDDAGAPASRPMLTRDQLCEMALAGCEVGAHSRSHACLTQLDDEALRDEVAGSRHALEAMLDRLVTSFAYPYGACDARVVAAAAGAGYAQAVCCMTGWALSNTDQLRIRRIPILRTDSLSDFARKLVFADSEFGWGRLARYYLTRISRRGQP